MSAVRGPAFRLIQGVAQSHSRCSTHGGWANLVRSTPICHQMSTITTQSDADIPDYAVEMACSNIRYGAGVTKEVGMDVQNLKGKNVGVFTDSNLVDKAPVLTALESLHKHGADGKFTYKVFDKVRVEPTDLSIQDGIDFAKKERFDIFVAVGGGSVIDTCKAANLFASAPEDAELLDYVNFPLGKGKPVTFPVKPLLAIPTTSGTGSETTGTSVFDYTPSKAKTGIADRALRPLLGIVDPLHTKIMPERVLVYSGFDVLCHALESYTAIPYQERKPCPPNPINRPAYQGSNPISDVWSLHAIRIVAKYFKRAAKDPEDFEARCQMHLASTFAGIGFGNAGCHLCHAMSYPISGNVKTYMAKGYNVDHPLVPHGLSVVITAPAVFNFTAPYCPERHLEGAEILGADITNAKKEDAGKILSDQLRKIMYDMDIDNGLTALGYTKDHIPDLVKGTLPQQRTLKLSPKKVVAEDLTKMFEDSLTIY